MKTLQVITILLSLGLNQVYSQTKSDTLKNETIVKLTKAKIQEGIIIQKINKSLCYFDVSTDALIDLRENNVTDKVLEAMITKQTTNDEANDKQLANNSTGDNYVFKESGIYFKKEGNYTALDPTLITSSQARGSFSTKYKAQIEGKEANYQFTETPEFYFNFNPVKKGLNSSNSNATSNQNYLDQVMNNGVYGSQNAQAISPNEFKLLKLDEGRGKREYINGEISFSGRTGFSIAGSYIIPFKYEKVSEHTYKLSFPTVLKPGEYCFVYLSNNSNNNPMIAVYGQNKTKVFDFGIKKIKIN